MIITTETAASIAKKMERPIARPIEVDTVPCSFRGWLSIERCVCVCGGVVLYYR